MFTIARDFSVLIEQNLRKRKSSRSSKKTRFKTHSTMRSKKGEMNKHSNAFLYKQPLQTPNEIKDLRQHSTTIPIEK